MINFKILYIWDRMTGRERCKNLFLSFATFTRSILLKYIYLNTSSIYTWSILQIYFKLLQVYFNLLNLLQVYLKHTSDILQVTSSILQPVELKKKKYTSSLAGHVHKYEASLRTSKLKNFREHVYHRYISAKFVKNQKHCSIAEKK